MPSHGSVTSPLQQSFSSPLERLAVLLRTTVGAMKGTTGFCVVRGNEIVFRSRYIVLLGIAFEGVTKIQAGLFSGQFANNSNIFS